MNAASRTVGWVRRIEMCLASHEKREYWLGKWRISFAKGLMGPLIKRWIKDASVCVCVWSRFTHICLPSYIALRLTYVHARQTTVMTSCLSIESRQWHILQLRQRRWEGCGIGCGDGAEVQVREEQGLAFQYPERITGQDLDGWSPQSYMGWRDGRMKGGEERDKYIEGDGWGEVRSARLWVRCLLSAGWRSVLTAETRMSFRQQQKKQQKGPHSEKGRQKSSLKELCIVCELNYYRIYQQKEGSCGRNVRDMFTYITC